MVKHLDDKPEKNSLFSNHDQHQVWMLPQEWKEWSHKPGGIRGTYQFIIMKIKLYFAYEPIEDAIKLTFKELMDFP